MSKTQEAIRLAHLKGYRVIDGQVVSPHGIVRKCTVHLDKRSGYMVLRFNIGAGDGKRFPVRVHQLVAYQKFGEAIFAPAVQVRHLDENSLNNRDDNIAIGTQSQNSLDQPKTKRQRRATGNQTHTPEFIAQLRADHAAGLGYKRLRAKHGVSLSVLSYYLSDSAKRQSFSHPISAPQAVAVAPW